MVANTIRSKRLSLPVKLTKKELSFIVDAMTELGDAPGPLFLKLCDAISRFEKVERYYRKLNANTPRPNPQAARPR